MAIYPALVYVICLRQLGCISWDHFLTDEPTASPIIPFLLMDVTELAEFASSLRPGSGIPRELQQVMLLEDRNGPPWSWLGEHETHLAAMWHHVMGVLSDGDTDPLLISWDPHYQMPNRLAIAKSWRSTGGWSPWWLDPQHDLHQVGLLFRFYTEPMVIHEMPTAFIHLRRGTASSSGLQKLIGNWWFFLPLVERL